MQLKTVRLYGELGKKYGREHKMAISSAGEAIRALCANFKDFKKHLEESEERGIRYKVCFGKDEYLKGTVEDFSRHNDKTLRITPVVIGAKGAGVFQTIIGVVLIIVGVIMNIYAPGSGYGVMAAGAAMVLGGVAAMLAPKIKTQQGSNNGNNPSYAFSGPINTSAQGNPVPVGYGRMVIGSQVISASVTTTDIPIS